MKQEPGRFFDINKLPKDYGILVFPISIARADNRTGQDPVQCFESIQYFSPKKISEPKVGLNMIYSDSLYMHSKEPASALKAKFMSIVLRHKNTFKKLVAQNWEDFQIQQAFSFEVWNQLYLDYKDGDFSSDFMKIKKIYQEDTYLQKLVAEDAEFCGRDLTKEQIDFFLEEHLMLYLLSKKRILLPNEYVQGREKWILWCYPGPALKGQIYFYQKNFLNLDALENPYQNSVYDLESKLLIDYMKIDLETYNYTYN